MSTLYFFNLNDPSSSIYSMWIKIMMYLWIAIGSGLGGTSRYWCSKLITSSIGSTFPWDIMIINILGSFIIGFFSVITGPNGKFIVSLEIKQFVMVGICGGYTTFSSFSLQTLNLLQNGKFLQAATNIIGSVVLCLIFVWLGFILATFVNEIKRV